jgi:hypothetical protein
MKLHKLLWQSPLLLTSIARAEDASDIQIAKLPATSAVVRPMQGDYSQHASAVRDLLKTISMQCKSGGRVFGEYPEDPGAVGMANVHWMLGYEMSRPPGPACTISISKLDSIRILPATNAAVLETTLGHSSQAGLVLLKWLPDSGYVQAGPTRMEYLDDKGTPETRVRIVLPIVKRTWPKTE